jgi:hypothetical protein
VVLSQRLGAFSPAALARPEREPPGLRRVAGGASANDDDGVPACGGHHRFGPGCRNMYILAKKTLCGLSMPWEDHQRICLASSKILFPVPLVKLEKDRSSEANLPSGRLAHAAEVRSLGWDPSAGDSET